MMKRLVSLLLATAILLALLPTAALAEDGTNITATGLDLSAQAPTVVTGYITNGGGTVTWDPTASPATLTFNNATIQASGDSAGAYAVRLPGVPVKVIFNGTNSIAALNGENAYAVDCQAATEFVLFPGSATTLTAVKRLDSDDDMTNSIAAGISAVGHNVTVTGGGALNVLARGSNEYALNAGGAAVTLDGCAFSATYSSKVTASTVTLNGVTVPTGRVLNLSEIDAVVYQASSTIEGELQLKNSTLIDSVLPHVGGAGLISMGWGNRYFTDGVRSGGDVSDSGLDLSYNTPTVRTGYTTDGKRTIEWEPTPGDGSAVTGGKLTLTDANISIALDRVYSTAHVVKLPAVPVTVVLNGTNNFTIANKSDATIEPVLPAPSDIVDYRQFSAFLCLDKTIFMVNGETNINVTNTMNMPSYALNNKAHETTVLGPGTLNINTSVNAGKDKAEIRSDNVTLGGNIIMSGVVKPVNAGSGTIRLGGVIVPQGKTLDYSAMGSSISILDADVSWYDASKTEFIITTPEQLAGLAQICNADLSATPFANKTVKLGADIDLDDRPWTPIWWNAGAFDGQGFAITGLNVTEGVERAIFHANDIFGGLFAYADNGAKLCNFTVSGSAELDYNNNQSVVLYAGGVVGYNANCTIINVGSNVDVETISSNNCFSGGIAGYTWRSAGSANCILNSYANGEISAESVGSRDNRAGGIAGVSENGPIVNCYYGGTVVTGKSAAGITYRIEDNTVVNCYSNFSGTDQAGIIDGTRYTTAASLLASLNESDVHAQIQTDYNVTPLPWKMGTNGMPVLAFPPQEQFDLTPGGTYWFDLSAQEIPGTVNSSLPDRTLHYVPFTYAGTVDAYVLKAASGDVLDASVQAAATADPGATYGYRYAHSLFVADRDVTHENSNQTDYIYAGSWTSLNNAGLIFGKAYASGGVSYTLRAPSAGSSYTGSDFDRADRRGAPAANEWDAVLDRSADYIKHWNPLYSWGQDTDAATYTSRAYRGRSSARCWNSDFKNAWDDLGLYGYRPVLEVPNTLPRDGLKVVTLNLGGGSVGGEGSIGVIVKNGASFTPPSGVGLTRPAGNTDTYFQWKDENGSLYLPDVSGVSIPATVTTLTAVWVPDEAGVTAVSVSGTEGTISGTTISVVLSCGALIPTDPSEVSITPVAGATVSALSTADNGVTWTFTVTSEDGLTQKHYTINVSVATDPAAANRAAVAAARSAIQDFDWTIPQNTANTEETVKAWIQAQLAGMDLNGVDCTVAMTGFTAAVAGGQSAPNGTNGSFGFTVSLSKGTGSTLATDTAIVSNGVINAATATPISGNGPGPDFEPAASGALYNAERTVWLTGAGLSASDMLIVERAPAGSEYAELLKLANGAEVFSTYNIYLRSGKKSTGSALYLHFDLNAKYAGEVFTLVHQKADKTYEYFAATADANGDTAFGPLYELSPFMLVRGTLTQTTLSTVVSVPATGDTPAPDACMALVLIAGAGLALSAAVRRKRRSR